MSMDKAQRAQAMFAILVELAIELSSQSNDVSLQFAKLNRWKNTSPLLKWLSDSWTIEFLPNDGVGEFKQNLGIQATTETKFNLLDDDALSRIHGELSGCEIRVDDGSPAYMWGLRDFDIVT